MTRSKGFLPKMQRSRKNNTERVTVMEFEKLQGIIAEVLNVEAEEIAMETTFVDDLGADSLDVFELLMALQDETGKTIPDDKITTLKTVGDVVNVLETL